MTLSKVIESLGMLMLELLD